MLKAWSDQGNNLGIQGWYLAQWPASDSLGFDHIIILDMVNSDWQHVLKKDIQYNIIHIWKLSKKFAVGENLSWTQQEDDNIWY